MERKSTKIMMVSRDYNKDDFYSHFKQVISLAEQHKVDTVLFPGWAYDRNKRPITYDEIFGKTSSINNLLIEIADIENEKDMETLFFSRNMAGPQVINQRFSKSSDSDDKKKIFINELPNRIFGNVACIVCGELGVLYFSRNKNKMLDKFNLNKQLEENNSNVILNYWHSYGRRYESNLKRKYLSQNKKTLISVWNQYFYDREPKIPWCVFHNGQNTTENINELPTPFNDRPDIRVGIYEAN